MELGICSEEIRRGSADEVLQAISSYGFKTVQLNMVNVFGSEIPPAEAIDADEIARVGKAAAALGLRIIGLNGTFNMLERSPDRLEAGISTFERLAEVCRPAGEDCRMLTLCTGSDSPHGKWAFDPYNATSEAWERCLTVARRLITIAEKHDIVLGLETEVTNVVDSPVKARRFIDELGSGRIKVIFDGANMINIGEANPADMARIIDEALRLLGDDTIVVHGKDIKPGSGHEMTFAGDGVLDFAHIVRGLRQHGFGGSMVLHHMKGEANIPSAVSYMRALLNVAI